MGLPTYRAGNQIRTGDLNLGKVALYQLSYARKPYCTDSGRRRIRTYDLSRVKRALWTS